MTGGDRHLVQRVSISVLTWWEQLLHKGLNSTFEASSLMIESPLKDYVSSRYYSFELGSQHAGFRGT